jgi:hypothetical protein
MPGKARALQAHWKKQLPVLSKAAVVNILSFTAHNRFNLFVARYVFLVCVTHRPVENLSTAGRFPVMGRWLLGQAHTLQRVGLN